MVLRRGAATDRGRMRDGNEDSYLSEGRLAVVADGMGGHLGGEVASATAIQELAILSYRGPWRDAGTALGELQAVIVCANRAIRQKAAGNRALDGMGTTLTALLEDGDTVYLAHVGDSRAYMLRDGKLSQLTEDHTLVQRLVNEGRLSPEEAERHPQKSIITRALGADSDVEIDTAAFKLRSGDRLLLCTDGLSGVVKESRIRHVLQRVRDPQQATEKLIALANEAGGPDNITVIVLDTEGAPGEPSDATGELSGPITQIGAPAGILGDGERAAAGERAFLAGAPERRSFMRRLFTGRRILVATVVLALLGIGAYAAEKAIYSRYWVGFDGDKVAVFRGLPPDVAPSYFSRVKERTEITRDMVPPAHVADLQEGITAKNLDDARRIATCAPLVLQGCTPSAGAPTSSTVTNTTTSTTRPPTTTTRRR